MIHQIRVIPSVLALLYENCPLTFKLRSYFAFLQKLPSLEVFSKEGYSWRFHGFRRRVPVLQSLFNKTTELRACGFKERRLQSGYFSCVIRETFVSTYFDEHLPTIPFNSLNFDILLG